MPTVLLSNLRRRILQLEKSLLPAISPTGVYSEVQYDQVRGYLLLCHAEIEAYLEELAVKAAEQSLSKWQRDNRVNRCLAALMLHHNKDVTPSPSTMTSHINLAVKNHIRAVRDGNHGIKENNLYSMYLPIGMDKSEVSATLLAELESLGAARGKVAHTAAKSVQTPPDPGSIRQQVWNVVSELDDFDALGSTLRRR